LLSDGRARKLKLSRLLVAGNRGRLDPPLDAAPLALDQFQLGQAQQVTRVVDPLGGTLPSKLVILA
jgi:hypothetical protein